MEEIIIPINVTHEVEISATGIPIHESKVDFCVCGPKNDVFFHFPAKMIEENKFAFTVSESVASLVNKELDYKIFVYYKNGRFEADKGKIKLISEKDVKAVVKKNDKEVKESAKQLTERLWNKSNNLSRPKEEKKKVEIVEEEVQNNTIEEELEPVLEATKPAPTPEPSPQLKQVKESLNYDGKVRDILKGITKSPSSSPAPSTRIAPQEVPVVESEEIKLPEETKSATFFEQLEEMKRINEARRQKKKIKEIISNSKKDS